MSIRRILESGTVRDVRPACGGIFETAVVFGLLIAAASCGVATDVSKREPKGNTENAIVGGTLSTPGQDSVVHLLMGDESCSGSLIEPNLVLTARHCVADPDETQECGPYGPTKDPGGIQVFVGADASLDSQPAAVGARITVPQTSNMCSFDVALVELDTPITGVPIAKLRFTELTQSEKTIAVGFGVDGDNQELPSRMQRETTILGVGPRDVPYTSMDGTKVTYQAPTGDVVTGESTCFGDSGGPLFDAQGQVVAVTSRGVPDLFPEGQGNHGNGCIDEPSVYAGVRFNEQIIRQAAKAAGHELPANAPTTQPSPLRDGGVDDAPDSGKPKKQKGDAGKEGDDTTDEPDPKTASDGIATGDDDKPSSSSGSSTKPTSSSKKSAVSNVTLVPAPSPFGCSSAGALGGGRGPLTGLPGPWAFGLAIGWIAMRRRAGRRG
jgi:hypothetical protein